MKKNFRLLFLFIAKAVQFALIVLGSLKLTDLLESNSCLIYQAGILFGLFTLLLPHYMHHDSIFAARKRQDDGEVIAPK